MNLHASPGVHFAYVAMVVKTNHLSEDFSSASITLAQALATQKYYADSHTQRALQEQRNECNDIHGLVMIRNVHDNLQQERCEWDAAPEAEVTEHAKDRDDGEDDRAAIVLRDPVVHAYADIEEDAQDECDVHDEARELADEEEVHSRQYERGACHKQ